LALLRMPIARPSGIMSAWIAVKRRPVGVRAGREGER